MNVVKIEQTYSLTRWPKSFAIFLTILVGLFTVPVAEAKLAQAGNCLNCHSEKNSTAQVTFSSNGSTVALTATPAQVWNHEGTVNVTPGQTFEIDFLYTGVLRNNADNPAVIFPTGSTWVANGGTLPPAGNGTGLVTDLANWNTWWNRSAAGMINWNEPVRNTGTGAPVGLSGDLYTKNWAGVAGWDEGNADAASDDGSEPDGVANRMGADMVLTAPTVNGTYDIMLVGVGSGSTGTKGYVATRMIVNVSGGDVIPPTVTSSTPAKNATGVTPNSAVTINFSEPVNCATVNTTNVTMSAGGWTFGSCSGSTATFNTSGQLASTAYTVTVTTAVTDVAGNALDPVNTLNVIGYITGVVATAPNVPTALAQYRSDGTTPIAAGGYTNQATVNIAADISDPDAGGNVRLHVDFNNDGVEDCSSILYSGNTRLNAQASCAVVNGTSYDWRVRTNDGVLNSAWVAFAGSPDFTVDLTAPVDGTLTPTPGDSQIVLNWTAATDATSGVASYTLRRVAGTTPPADCATGTLVYSGALLNATDTGLTNGADYAYRVCATDNVGWTSGGATATAQPAAGCTYADPTVTILTASRSITNDGGFADYTVQVTNNDSVICGNTIFTLSAGDTNSTNFYASTLIPTTLTVAPGAAAVTTLRVTAKANQPNASTNATTVSTAADGNHIIVNSAAVTTTINVSGGGCIATGSYLNANGDQMSTSR